MSQLKLNQNTYAKFTTFNLSVNVDKREFLKLSINGYLYWFKSSQFSPTLKNNILCTFLSILNLQLNDDAIN